MQLENKIICSILPPHILRKPADKPELRDRFLRNLATTEQWRGIRQAIAMPLLAQQLCRTRRRRISAKRERLPYRLLPSTGNVGFDCRLSGSTDCSTELG